MSYISQYCLRSPALSSLLHLFFFSFESTHSTYAGTFCLLLLCLYPNLLRHRSPNETKTQIFITLCSEQSVVVDGLPHAILCLDIEWRLFGRVVVYGLFGLALFSIGVRRTNHKVLYLQCNLRWIFCISNISASSVHNFTMFWSYFSLTTFW